MRMKKLMNQFRKAKLTERQIDVLAMYYFDGFGASEVADRLGLNESTVREHIAAGLKKLRPLGMVPRRVLMEEGQAHVMTNVGMDNIGPDEIKAVW